MPGLTRCRHPELGTEAELPTDALGAWAARGWEPITESRSLETADVERIQAEEAAAAHVQAVIKAVSAAKRPNVDQVLDEVAGEPAAAAAALAAEQSHESPRSTLVARLNQIVNPAGTAGTPEGEN